MVRPNASARWAQRAGMSVACSDDDRRAQLRVAPLPRHAAKRSATKHGHARQLSDILGEARGCYGICRFVCGCAPAPVLDPIVARAEALDDFLFFKNFERKKYENIFPIPGGLFKPDPILLLPILANRKPVSMPPRTNPQLVPLLIQLPPSPPLLGMCPAWSTTMASPRIYAASPCTRSVLAW